MPYQLVWLIFLLPLFSFAIISLFFRPFLNHKPKLGGYITIASLMASLGLSIWALTEVLATPGHKLPIPDINWVIIEGGVTIHLGLIMDSLTVVMLLVVTVVSLMVQIYSQGYMTGDPGYHRYFAFMSLFTASMLGLVLADNLLFLYIFWELVGICSYLLIGFWFHRPAAANAAKKAFVVTRLGDFGFLAAILLLFSHTGTFDIAELHSLAITGALAGTTLTWAAIGIFAGAVGKSAQSPLHVWLPDAMEGPTPVSALIHAATMVAAGIFLVARCYPLFAHSVEALTTVAIIGGFTAIFAATMGLVMTDIKRVLAYSTISQLGYMMLGLGTGGIAIGIFHLFNHAFFKALLFLGAGSINHATGTFDMRQMGGLRRVMPWTYATFLIASLSIAGIWPLSGFWSKDEILASSLINQPILFYLAMLTVFMTAFYMFRVVFMTFGGEYRGGSPEAHGKPHESPSVMIMPMIVLAVLAVVSGLFNVTGGFSQFLGHGETHSFVHGFFGILAHPLPWISLILAGLGILLAYAMYSAKWLSAERIGSMFKPLYTLFYRKYWFDELYENIVVRIALLNGVFAGLEFFDSKGVDGGINTFLVQRIIVHDFFEGLLLFDNKGVDGGINTFLVQRIIVHDFFEGLLLFDNKGVDRAVNGIADTTVAAGRAIRKAQTGQLQLYGLFIGIGVLAIILCLYFF